MPDRRASHRKAVSGDVKIHWNDDLGNYFNLNGSWCDISEAGGGLHLRRSIRPGTVVQIESPWLMRPGMAVVRDCDAADGHFRIGLEFTGETRGQPVHSSEVLTEELDRRTERCGRCHTRFAPNRDRCPQCGEARGGMLTCALCGSSGPREAIGTLVGKGMEAGDPHFEGWTVHSKCLDRLRREVRESLAVLRCPVCYAEVGIEAFIFGQIAERQRCPRCGIPPDAIEAGWLKRADRCAICSLPIYAIIHAVLPTSYDNRPRSARDEFGGLMHRMCAQRLRAGN